MKSQHILIFAGVLLLLGLGAAQLLIQSGDESMPAASKADVDDGKTVVKSGEGGGKGRSLLPGKLPGQEEGPKEDGEEAARPHRMKVAEQPALSGLGYGPSTEADRERAGVTEQFGRGVTVTRIHPDAPAAEIALEEGDVIVRAETTNINSPADLETAVGDRDHTLITFVREGVHLQVVLQKPFDPNQKTGAP